MGRGTSVCQITIDSDRPQMRIEGTYVREFYERVKAFVPGTRRAYIPSGPYWLVDALFFARVFELAYIYFTKIHLIENGKAEEFVTGKL